MKGYKTWDQKDKKIILGRDVTFDEVSMVKLTDSQQVESEKISKISQQIESDATPPPPNRTILFEITPEVTQGGDLVADQDAEDDGGLKTD